LFLARIFPFGLFFASLKVYSLSSLFMAKKGRPAFEITKEIIDRCEQYGAQGLTYEQIANCLHLHVATLIEKRKEYPELDEAIKRGRDQGVANVTNALYEKAVSGDNTAMIFFLKNRAPESWRDNPAPKEEQATPQRIEVTLVDPDKGD
jgi:hypothetical protein